ncbi:hypothetical protein C0993_004585 [Termitomyces sp. T159_Od127]|nr:hypothetical protein C0993_004585 [Termitomyces sp. T159_Od127]
MDVAKITQWRSDKDGLLIQKLGVIRFNPIVSEHFAKDKVSVVIHLHYLPLLIKLKPWLDYKTGGYLLSQNSAMHFQGWMEQQLYLKKASFKGNIKLVFAGLNILSSMLW